MEGGDLSERCRDLRDESVEALLEYLKMYEADQYDPTTNKDGVINLGSAVNGIHADLVKEKLLSQGVDVGPDAYHYFHHSGTSRLKKAMAEYMTEFFEASQPVQPDNLYFSPCTIGVIDLLSHCLADPGDVFLCVTPVYGGVIFAIKARALAEIWPIPLSSQDKDPFNLTLLDVEVSYKKAIEAGKHVKALFFINPGNPVGYVSEPSLLNELLHFCHRNNLHFVSNEIFGMSVHDPEVKFHSVLKLPSLPDPNKTHVIYGISKDLGLTKLRVGVLHTCHKVLQSKLDMLIPLSTIAYPVMESLAGILEDKEWCRSFFCKTRAELRSRFSFLSRKLECLDLKIQQAPAGIFVWVNFQKYCQPLTPESEMHLFTSLVEEAKLIIFPGDMFSATERGWFRIVISVEESEFYEGIKRLENFLRNWK